MKWKLYILCGLALMSFSCSNFLDVTPKDQQTAEQLYSSKAGFYTAANGIYDGLASDELYGENMTWKAIDIMSKRYNTLNTNIEYQDLSSNNYTSLYVEPILSEIWQKAYELILAANLLIDEVNQQSGLLTENEASLMKGEMLAVRAFLHLDMLRLFGPRGEDNPEALSIPYNESSAVTTLPLLPFNEVIKKISNKTHVKSQK